MLCKPRWSLHKICQYSSCSPFQTKLLSGGFWQNFCLKTAETVLFVRIQTLFQKLSSEKEEDDGKKSESQQFSNFSLFVIYYDYSFRFGENEKGRGEDYKIWQRWKDMSKFTEFLSLFWKLLMSQLMKRSHLSQSSFAHRLIVKLSCWLKSESLLKNFLADKISVESNNLESSLPLTVNQ